VHVSAPPGVDLLGRVARVRIERATRRALAAVATAWDGPPAEPPPRAGAPAREPVRLPIAHPAGEP